MSRLTSFARQWVHNSDLTCASATSLGFCIKTYALTSSLAVSALCFFSPTFSHTEAVGDHKRELREQHDTGAQADMRPCKRTSYRAYTRQGNNATLTDIVKAMEGVDVVLLGETHDDRIAHLLQLQLLHGAQQCFSRTDRHVALSLEMFERDVQGVMDEYLSGAITERDLKQDGRPWPNYDSDYRPLVELAKAEGLPVICANAPRRYVSMAGRNGRASLETLPATSLKHLPPLPYLQPSQAYLEKTNRTMQAAAEQMQDFSSEQRRVDPSQESANDGQSGKCSPDVSAQSSEAASPEEGQHRCMQTFGPQEQTGGRTTESTPQGQVARGGCPYIGFTASTNFMDAQTLWDASMAYSIAEHLDRCSRETESCAHALHGSSAKLQIPQEKANEISSPEASCDSTRNTKSGRPLVLHVCGKFHAEGGMGIPEHLEAYREGLRILIVAFLPSSNDVNISTREFVEEDLDQYGDFIVLTDLHSPRSYAITHPV